MEPPSLFGQKIKDLENFSPAETLGRVKRVDPMLITAHLPQGKMGELVLLGPPRAPKTLKAEIVAIRDDLVLLAPLGSTREISKGWEVKATGETLGVEVSDDLVGRVLDGMGSPMDGLGALPVAPSYPLEAPPPPPLSRPPIATRFETGVRAIDSLLTLGKGQRVGLFAGSGVGKSTLMGMIAQRATADVIVVCLVGERGREVREFIEESLGPKGRAKSVLVVSTSDSPALVRAKAPLTATTVAEYFRDRGKSVLLFVDSLTRFARAEREIALSLGEPPARRGFPPSVFARLPSLLERAGNSDTGSITAIYTVLMEGGDMEEPVTDEVRGIVDGHLMLSRELAALGHYPALDVRHSVSRVMGKVTTPEHRQNASRVKSYIAALERSRDLIRVGAYEPGGDPLLDTAVKKEQEILSFLRQGPDDPEDFSTYLRRLAALAT